MKRIKNPKKFFKILELLVVEASKYYPSVDFKACKFKNPVHKMKVLKTLLFPSIVSKIVRLVESEPITYIDRNE